MFTVVVSKITLEMENKSFPRSSVFQESIWWRWCTVRYWCEECPFVNRTGCFFSRKVPPRKVLSMELVPLNRIKSPSTLVPPKATRGAKNNQNRRFLTLQWCSAVVFKHYTIFSLFFQLQTCDTGHSKLPSLKNSTSHSNAGLSLVFHLPHSSSDHALLVFVDVINHMFSLTEELFILSRGTNSILRTFLGGTFRKKHPVISKVRFHHEGGLSESRYFELFFSTH